MKEFICELRHSFANHGPVLTAYHDAVLTAYEVKNAEKKQLFGRGISRITVFKKGSPFHSITTMDIYRCFRDSSEPTYEFELAAKSLRVVRNVGKAAAEEDIFFHGDTLYVSAEAGGLELGTIQKQGNCLIGKAKLSGVLTRSEKLSKLGISQTHALAYLSSSQHEFDDALRKTISLDASSNLPSTEKEFDEWAEKSRIILRAMSALANFWEHAEPAEIYALYEAFSNDLVGNVLKTLNGSGDYTALYTAISTAHTN